MISFIHLADIHFTKESGDPYDLDADIRQELINDIRVHAKTTIDSFDSILICGDIAFSAKKEEYEEAKNFLKEICEVLSIPESSVFCVPGNHDVDQSLTKSSTSVTLLQGQLEFAETQAVFDTRYAKYSRSQHDISVLYSPINNYNNFFANHYECSISFDEPFKNISLPINEKYNLSLSTINSTLISSHMDHADKTNERLMRIPLSQIPSNKGKNTINLTLCHHPPECWVDNDNILQNKLNVRAQIQLYGHKHTQSIIYKNEYIIINSGATHPERSGDWQPRYNWITIDIINKDNKPTLELKVYPRIWDVETNSKFISDTIIDGKNNYVKYYIDLSDTSNSQSNYYKGQTNIDKIQLENNLDIISGVSRKKFTYDFFSLSPVKRNHILNQLGLIKDEDDGKGDTEIYKELISRAKEANKIEEFWINIKKYKQREY